MAAAIHERLDGHLRARGYLAERIYRELLMELHRRGVVTIDAIHDEARKRAGEAPPEATDDPNRAQRQRWDDRERSAVEELTREYVAQTFNIADVDDLVNLALKREEVYSLEKLASVSNVSFRELADKIQGFCQLPLGETLLAPEEVVGTRVGLIRHFLSDQLEFIAIAKHHLRIRDFDDITRRIIGSDSGMGRIGGKAGGMLLASRILAESGEHEKVYLPTATPESFYLRSDVIEDFLRLNGFDEYQHQKYKPVDQLAREYPMVQGLFRNGEFPLKIHYELRKILERIGNHPLIVRSSSLLEDRLGTAFCGKYASLFVANQGTLEQRLQALLGAVGEVYASILSPDPILYRREHNLIDYVEGMAVLIQKVIGFPCGQYFLPSFAGVAFSRNEFRWSPRIRREDGLVRIVVGLGTRAVDRSGPDYPRMVALGEPTLRPESTVQEIRRSAQRNVDVLDLNENRFRSVRFDDILAQGLDFPMLDKIVSVYRDGELFSPAGSHVDAEPANLYITFDKLVREAAFVQRVRDILRRLEDVYQLPVDVEFACDGKKFYVLQCRGQSQADVNEAVTIPNGIPDRDVIFDAHRFVRTGLIEGIEHIVYVDPVKYDAVTTKQRCLEIARVIGRINHAFAPKTFILVGPGRWGSTDIQLGVPVRYADINRCRMLVEVARQRNGFSPEVSFGTHFFQDLVEAGIHYLPLYPDEPGNRFNTAFMDNTPNCLPQIVPADAEFAEEIRVIHIPAVAAGRRLTIAMDGETDTALAYLK